MTRPVLLVGSVPLATATEVFETAAAHLDGAIHQIPDGETGERLKWVGWQNKRLRERGDLEVVAELDFGGPVPHKPALFGPKKGTNLTDIDFAPLGYTEVARASYADFKRLKEAGKIAPEVRFQVSLPTPMVISSFFRDRWEEVMPGLVDAFRKEAAAIADAIPHHELTIQWDLARETQNEESLRHPENDRLDRGTTRAPLDVSCQSVADISRAIPEGVALGIHLCFGDPDGAHLIEPVDTSSMVDLLNNLRGRVERKIDYVHLPVPISRSDAGYFAPLDGLDLAPATQIYLGLVHQSDGLSGAMERIAAATPHVAEFGVATECGLGRVKPAQIPQVLDLHREIAAAGQPA